MARLCKTQKDRRNFFGDCIEDERNEETTSTEEENNWHKNCEILVDSYLEEFFYHHDLHITNTFHSPKIPIEIFAFALF